MSKKFNWSAEPLHIALLFVLNIPKRFSICIMLNELTRAPSVCRSHKTHFPAHCIVHNPFKRKKNEQQSIKYLNSNKLHSKMTFPIYFQKYDFVAIEWIVAFRLLFLCLTPQLYTIHNRNLFDVCHCVEEKLVVHCLKINAFFSLLQLKHHSHVVFVRFGPDYQNNNNKCNSIQFFLSSFSLSLFSHYFSGSLKVGMQNVLYDVLR